MLMENVQELGVPGESADGVAGPSGRASTSMLRDGLEGAALIWIRRLPTGEKHDASHLMPTLKDLPAAASN